MYILYILLDSFTSASNGLKLFISQISEGIFQDSKGKKIQSMYVWIFIYELANDLVLPLQKTMRRVFLLHQQSWLNWGQTVKKWEEKNF